MPPKKKKQKEERCVDVMSLVDEVEACLERAEHSSRVCLEGITKADLALRESRGDRDIQCVVLVRRTELLIIAVKNSYNLDSLRRRHSLESCVEDLDSVLSDTADDAASKQLRDSANAARIKVQKLIKDMGYEEKKKSGKSSNRNSKTLYEPTGFKRYDPSKTCFKSIDKINPFLLQDIVECYRQSRHICRTCYYRRHVQEPVISSGRHCKGCKKIPQPLMMIPSSKMCENLGGMKWVPVPPPPKMMMQPSSRHRAFQICKNKEHQLCDDKATVGENWFAHSIEELVIWTVQRHYGCKFQKYIDDYHYDLKASEQSPAPAAGEQSEDGLDTDDLFSDSYSDNYDSGDERFDYYPEDVVFRDVADIPQNLLLNVIEKYRSIQDYCKYCFYKSDKQGVSCVDRGRSNTKVCSICRRPWKAVQVIPASELCWNFGEFEFLPISPWPKGKPSKDPFEYCKKKDHHRCFRVYIDSEFWYPHSVEEMVIWTVEREKQCSFFQFIEEHRSIPGKPVAKPLPPLQPYQPQPQPKRPPLLEAPHPPSQQQMNIGPAMRVPGGPPMGPPQPGPMPPPSQRPMGGQRPPLLSRPMTISQPPHTMGGDIVTAPPPGPPPNQQPPQQVNGGPPANPPNLNNAPPPGAMVGQNGPYPARFVPGGAVTSNSMLQFANGGGGAPMMYPLSQPNPPMYPHGRPVLIPRASMGPTAAAMLSQQHIPYPGGPGPGPPPPGNGVVGPGGGPRMIAMAPPYSHYMVNPGFGVPIFTNSNNPNPPAGMVRPGPPEASNRDTNFGGGGGGSGGEVPASSVTPQIISTSTLNQNMPPTANEGETVKPPPGLNIEPSSASKASAGRRNYKVADPPTNRVVGSPNRAPLSPSSRVVGSPSRSTGAGGMSSAGGGQLEVKAVSVAPRLATRVEEISTPLIFKFSEVEFKTFVDIPSPLLRSLAVCFKDKMSVCRKCFYGERHLSKKSSSQSGGTELCSTGEHEWLKPIIVIPGCELCNNEPSFQKGEHVPLLPLPPVAVLKKCPNRNHHKCFTKGLEKDLFQAHSVEEMVVWIVESEKDCSFEDFVKEFQLEEPKANIKGGSGSSPASPSYSVAASPNRPSSSAPTPGGSGSATTAMGSIKSPSSSISKPTRGAPPIHTISPRMKPKNIKKYHPKDVSFVTISDIPNDLLVSVAECFKTMKFVCRICFFESNCTALVTKRDKTCKKDHLPWKGIKVIPPSPLCVSSSKYIPLPPLPKHMRQSSIPFVVCKKNDHKTCFAMSKGTNPWFPHTVEELVVWTVERETSDSFDQVYEQYLEEGEATDHVSEATSMTTPHSSSGGAELGREVKVDPSPTSDYFNRHTGAGVEPVTPSSESGVPTSTTFSSGGWTGESDDVGSEMSEGSDYKLPDEQRFREALNLTKQSEEFPLGSYRSQPRPLLPNQQLQQQQTYNPHDTHFENLFRPPSSKGAEPAAQGGDSSEDMISLSFTGITATGGGNGGPNLEDSFGISGTGVPFLPYATTSKESESGPNRNEYPGTSWNHSGGNQFKGEVEMTKAASDRLWSRVVGGKQSVAAADQQQKQQSKADAASLDGMSDSTFHTSSLNASYGLDDDDVIHLRPCDDFIHQSQVENDTFQPYAGNNHSPLLIHIPKGTRGKDVLGSIEGKWTEEDDASVDPSTDYKPPSSASKSPLPGDQSSSRRRALFSEDNNNNNSILLGEVKAPGSGLAPGGAIGGRNPWSRGDDNGVALGGGVSIGAGGIGSAFNGGGVWGTGVGVSSEIPPNSVTATRSSSMLVSAFPASTNLDQAVELGVGATALRPHPAGPPGLVANPAPLHDISNNNHLLQVHGGVKNSPKVGGDSGHSCLLCYTVFESAGELGNHFSSSPGHLERAIQDSGGEVVWQYAPPPPHLPNPSALQLCTNCGCVGAPTCKLPHSHEELMEWQQRHMHRDQRVKTGSLQLARISPKIGARGEGTPISASKVLRATVSDVYQGTNNCSCWDITIHGKNWLNLFGVSVSSASSSWIFKITHIEEPTTHSIFHPHSSSWSAPPFRQTRLVRQCLPLGSVEIKVKAIPSSSGKKVSTGPEAEVRLDLGFRQFFYIELSTSTEGQGDSSNASNHLQIDTSNEQPQTFVPQHPWHLLSPHGSSSSDDLASLNIEGEDLTLQHVPIEDWGCSLTDDHSQNNRGV